MLRRYREMDIHLSGVILGVHGAFGQMFLHRRTNRIGIFMEKQQAFRQLPVIQAFQLQ